MIGVAAGLAAAALGGAAYWLSRPPRRRTAGDLQLHRLRDGVFMYRGFFSNSAIVGNRESTVVVDTQVAPRAALRMREAVLGALKGPITHVVNTHYHGDHSGGNAAFAGAEILASEETARFIVERDWERTAYARTFGLQFNHVHATALPTRTFAGETTLDAGGEQVVVRQLGAAETTDASIVFWPARGVVACGDAVSTWDYPFLGVPFLDEGLRGDGAWLSVLRQVRALSPELLIPGHGPALTSARSVAARLDLLMQLYADLIGACAEELGRGLPIPEVVDRVATRLGHYPKRRDLFEHTVSQRFAIYRCVNSLVPERAGKGWWHDLRPSVVRRASPSEVQGALAELGDSPTSERLRHAAARAVLRKARPLAISLLEAWLEKEPSDAAAHGLLADVLFDGARDIRPSVDGMEYISAATERAKAALALEPNERLGLLNLGVAEVFGGMVLAQDMTPGIEKLERALQESGEGAEPLTATQRQKAEFFLGKAHQMEGRETASDRHFRRALPAWARPLFPLLRARLRATP